MHLIQRMKELKIWKKKPFYVTAAVFGVFILFCVVRIVTPCHVYEYEGGYSFETGVGTESTAVYGGISLRPGVYKVELDYAAETDLVGVCNVADGTVFSGGILSNGDFLYSAREKTEYYMWLYEPTEALQVMVSYNGNGSLVIGNLKITETNQLWTMLLAFFCFWGLVVGAGMAFYYYDKAYAVAPEAKNAFFWVTVIGLVASIPYLCGYSITGADLTYHLQRIEGVKDGLLGGQFPVRLEPKWLYGHGYANGIFYCNTFLYFPALLRLLGFTVSASYNMYCIALNIATAWISYYCFRRIFGKRSIGIICGALYTLSIFRIYKLIITSATGEGTAVTFLPLVFYGLYRIFTEDPQEKKYKTAWIPLMLGFSGLMQSHVLTCEITALVTLLFCIANIRKIFCRNTFLELFKAALSSLLVSLWFLVPFLDYYMTQDMHIKHVSARTIQFCGLYLAHLAFHFWKTGSNTPDGENGMQYSHPVGIGLVLMIALGVFFILWFSGAFGRRRDRRTYFGKTTAVLGVLLLYMSMNIFPWDRIQALHPVAASLVSSLQFPNRFLGWGTVCLVSAFGGCLWYFKNRNLQYGYWLMAGVAVIGVTTSSMYLLDYVNGTQNYYELYNEEGMGFGYISGAEYLIEGTEEGKLTYALPAAGQGVGITGYEKSFLKVDMQCVNTQDADGYVDLPLLLYKGYRAYHTETGEAMEVCAGENNTVRVLVPAGFEGDVHVEFVSPVYWRISEAVSVVTVIGLAALWWRSRRKGYAEKEIR